MSIMCLRIRWYIQWATGNALWDLLADESSPDIAFRVISHCAVIESTQMD